MRVFTKPAVVVMMDRDFFPPFVHPGKCVDFLCKFIDVSFGFWLDFFSSSLLIWTSKRSIHLLKKMFSSNIVEAEGFQPLRRVRVCYVLIVSFGRSHDPLFPNVCQFLT